MITQTLTSFLASISLGTASVQELPKIAHISDCGTATYYDNWYQGRQTATGAIYDRYKLSAASWYYPLGTWLRVTNTRTNRSIRVEVNDRGGYGLLDLSEEASIQLSSSDQPDNHSICAEVLQ
jgi:rare lipoprotein A (peptidoglycan hydrolase)